MQLNIPIVADYEMLRQRRQARIDYNNNRENMRRRFKDYVAGDEVMILANNPKKLDERAAGPYTIQQVHANGTITVQRNGGVVERVNVRRVKPHRR